jgi:hypothetical protein
MNPNGIKKNDWIQVTRDNGEVILGIATKVAPWSKNPKRTVVNYKDVADTFTSRADAVRCKIADPILVAATAANIASKYAPLDACMAGWSLGKMKKGPQMMEGYYFASPILFNDVKVGEIIDEGNGGCVITRFKDHNLAKTFEDACDKWALENGADGRYADGKEHFWGWWDDARTKGIDAKTFFKNEKEEMLPFMAGR